MICNSIHCITSDILIVILAWVGSSYAHQQKKIAGRTLSFDFTEKSKASKSDESRQAVARRVREVYPAALAKLKDIPHYITICKHEHST